MGMVVAGLAFALAAKDMVQNLFGSVTVLLDRTFSVGDWITVGDQEGTVERIGFRSTRIRTFYNSVVTVPFGGIVTIRHREPGETVSPGLPVLTVMDPEDRWVRIYVREDRVGEVSLGQRATITSDTYGDRTYRGEVIFISSEAEFTPRNVQTTEERVKLVYAVKVQITEDPSHDLKAGIPADVVLEGTGESGV